jgi:hypothetical protein
VRIPVAFVATAQGRGTVTVRGRAVVCSTAAAGAGWVNTPLADQTGTFSVEFEATPSESPIDSVMALSSGPQTTYPGFACLARFSTTGNIDARNGGAYAADNEIPYSANLKYKFRLVMDIAAHTYSIFVTSPDGIEQTVGTDFAFRAEQNTVANLNNWGVTVDAASGPVRYLRNQASNYIINWDSIACDNRDFLMMGDPFRTYNEEVEQFLAKPRTADVAIDGVDS